MFFKSSSNVGRIAAFFLALLLSFGSCFFPVQSVKAQQSTASNSENEQRDLQDLLKPDGSLDMSKNYRGSLNVKGWRIKTSETGEPRFEPDDESLAPATAANDAPWDERFYRGEKQLNGTIFAALFMDGNLYIGGDFTQIGDNYFNHIAKWDGANWTGLGGNNTSFGNGVNGTVSVIHSPNGFDFYVGGSFTTAYNNESNPVRTNYIAKWNSSGWSALGDGFDGAITSIAATNDGQGILKIYVSGSFSYAYNSPTNVVNANNVAVWNGTNWSALGNGLDSWATVVMPGADGVYFGGFFTTAYNSTGSIAANRIVRWDETSQTWVALGSGLNGFVATLAARGSDIYVGGKFTTAGGITARNIAVWSGGNWAELGGGVSQGSNPLVNKITLTGTDIYVGGRFEYAGLVNCKNIAKWSLNTNSWSRLGSGTNSEVTSMVFGNDGRLFVGGTFTEATNDSPNVVGSFKYLAKWDGSNWSGIKSEDGLGVNGNVYTVTVDGNDVYIGGTFSRVGNLYANNIAKWNGTNWSILGQENQPNGNGVSDQEVPAEVRAILVRNGIVYVGGLFDRVHSSVLHYIAARSIAAYNPATQGWSRFGAPDLSLAQPGNGVLGPVYALAVKDNFLYVGGDFNKAYTNPISWTYAHSIARWDLNSQFWSPLGTGSENGNGVRGVTTSSVKAIVTNDSGVYIGGQFYATVNSPANVVVTNGIARWDGNSWSALGGGRTTVKGLANNGNDIYAITDAEVSRWDGANWTTIGTLRDGSEGGGIAFSNGNIYIGGRFNRITNPDSSLVNLSNVARWNGTSWSSLGSGVDQWAFAVAVQSDNKIYIGGTFNRAGLKPSSKLGLYHAAMGVWTGGMNQEDWHTAANWQSNIVPLPGEDVFIPADMDESVVINNNVTVKDLTIENDASVEISSGHTLTVTGKLTMTSDSQIRGNGSLVFNGAEFINEGNISTPTEFGTGNKTIEGNGMFLGNVIFTAGASVRLKDDVEMKSVVINSGSTFDISLRQLKLTGEGVPLVNNGTLVTSGSNIHYYGFFPQTISSDLNFDYHNLTIESFPASLNNNITVRGVLRLNTDLNTGGFTLTMPETAFSQGVGDVIGNVRRTGFTNSNTLSFGNPNNSLRFPGGTPPTDVTVNLVKSPPTDMTSAVYGTYTITPNGGSNYTATLRLRYEDGFLNGNPEATLGMWRKNGAVWTNLGATTRNSAENWVELTGVTQFSPWTLARPLAPTAATVNVGGRLTTADGRGISNAKVLLTDENATPRTARTNAFGYYRFDEVEVGRTYVFSVAHKIYRFNAQIHSITEENLDINFFASEF